MFYLDTVGIQILVRASAVLFELFDSFIVLFMNKFYEKFIKFQFV